MLGQINKEVHFYSNKYSHDLLPTSSWEQRPMRWVPHICSVQLQELLRSFRYRICTKGGVLASFTVRQSVGAGSAGKLIKMSCYGRILENKLERTLKNRYQTAGSIQNYGLLTHLKIFNIKLSLNIANSTSYNDLLVQINSGRFYFLETMFTITHFLKNLVNIPIIYKQNSNMMLSFRQLESL